MDITHEWCPKITSGEATSDFGTTRLIWTRSTLEILDFFSKTWILLRTMLLLQKKVMWYYCAVTGESKKIVFTSGATEKITSGGATSDFWSPHK
jgi:hypothetical protein